MARASSTCDHILEELIIHLTGARGQKLAKHLSAARSKLIISRSVRPLKQELEIRFWNQVTVCKDHSHHERAEHLQDVAEKALSALDHQPIWFSDVLHFLLELSPSPLELQYVERRCDKEDINETAEQVYLTDSYVLEQGVLGALGDSDSWSSVDSIENGLDQINSAIDETEFQPPTEDNYVEIDNRPLVKFYSIQNVKIRSLFQWALGFSAPERSPDAAATPLFGSLQKFHKRMSYLRKWHAMPMKGRSLTFQAFAGAIAEELDKLQRELASIERLPRLTVFKLLRHLEDISDRPLKLCQMCETVTAQSEPWVEAVQALSHLSDEGFFLKTAKPMLSQIGDLLVKGEFHSELFLEQDTDGDVVLRGSIPEKLFLHSYLDRIQRSAQCAVQYKRHTGGKALLDAEKTGHFELADITLRVESLLRRSPACSIGGGIPVHNATKAAILPLCKLINTALVDRLRKDYDAFRILRKFQEHSFVVSNEMHAVAETVFYGRCAREPASLNRLLEDLLGTEWHVKSIEPFVIADCLSWPLTIFTGNSNTNYTKVRTYVLRVKEATHALVHMPRLSQLDSENKLARFRMLCVMDLLNQHITLTAQECISLLDLASGAEIEDIIRRHTSWFERTAVRTLMHPKVVRNTLDDLAQTSLRFAREEAQLEQAEKKFVFYLGYLTKAVSESLPVLAAQLAYAAAHFR